MMAAPNAISQGLTTALTDGVTKGGWVVLGISAAKPGTAVQARVSVAAHAIFFFLGFHSSGAFCPLRATATLAVRTRVLLIISLLSFVPLEQPGSRISGGSEQHRCPDRNVSGG